MDGKNREKTGKINNHLRMKKNARNEPNQDIFDPPKTVRPVRPGQAQIFIFERA